MAPEQLEGKEVDARTDIFAFGVVVYEMATGRKAFEGKSQASLIAKILETDPTPMVSLQPMTPPALDRVVKRCLAKEPDNRWQTASDLCEELKWIALGDRQTSSAQAIPAKGIRAFGRRPLAFTVGALLVALITSLAVWNLKPSLAPPKPVTRFTITLPPGQSVGAPDQAGVALALSADGTKLAYVSTERGTQRIYIRAMDGLEAKPVSGTEGAADPFFSPDGEWLGFFAGGKLKKIPVDGGAAVTLADAPGLGGGGRWSSQGTIALGAVGGVEQLSGAGGKPQVLTHLEKEEIIHAFPEFLPDGSEVLFVANGASPQIVVQSLRSGERRSLVSGGTPRYARSGHLLYVQSGTLMAAPFDVQQLRVTGAAVPVVQGVLQSPTT
jgi:hypothetical protein